MGFTPARPASSSGSVGLIVGIIVGVFVLIGIVGAGAAIFLRSRGAAVTAASDREKEAAYGDGAAWSDDDASVPVSSRDATWGNRAAPVTLVVFSDFECPFCSKFEATLSQVEQKYGPEKLRVVWKHNPLPFHNNARPAAIAAEAVFRLGGSKAFWKFHDSAFASQRELNPDSYERWAMAAGVDLTKFRGLVSDPAVAAKIDADMAEGKTVGVTGTPNSYINGFLLTGAQPLEKVVSIVDTELASAQRAIAAGTPADRVYAKLSQENKTRNAAPKPAAEPAADDPKVYDVPVGKSPVLGPATAKVTIVEFADFQCPFCKRVDPTLAQLRETYGDKIRIVWKNLPLSFHKNAAPAAELAMEARAQKGDKGFWAAHDLLFKNQTELGQRDLEAYAAQLGLDVSKARRAILNETHKAEIAEDERLASELDAKGTPHFFVNGRRVAGAQPLDKFKAMIDRELAR